MFYAISLVNLLSLRELDPIGALLFPKEILGKAVIIDKRRYGTESIRLTCPEEQAEAITTLVRKKYSKSQFVMFKSKTGNGSWKKI